MSNSKNRILIVDDHNIFRNRLAKSLKERGWQVETACCYDEAVEKVRVSTPDRAIVDLRMPGKSGLELVRDLHDEFGDVEWVILTGYGSISTAVDAIKAGAVNYIPKPADVDDILRAFGDDVDEVETQTPSLARAEWEHIQRVLSDCDGNITHAARKLGIHRRTLQRKLDQYAPS